MTIRSILLGLILLLPLLFAVGCTGKTPDDSTIPHARPASWEGGLPGFGPGMGY